MTQTAVYTYKVSPYGLHTNEKEQIEWLVESLRSAKAVGYSTALYTNKHELETLEDLDYFFFREDSTYIWDSLKIQVLKELKFNNFFLTDSDILFKAPIEFNNSIDLYFDIVERKFTWESLYLPTIKQINKLGVLQNIKYWDSNLAITYNTGILKFNNLNLVQEYTSKWYEVYDVITPYVNNPLDPFYLTPILTQYLLTIISQNYNTKPIGILKEYPKSENKYYTHYRGGLKRKYKGNLI